MGKFGVSVLLFVFISGALATPEEKGKGPNPGPVAIKPSSTLRNRFSSHFHKSSEKIDKKSAESAPSVKILPGLSSLSRSSQVLKHTPSPVFNRNAKSSSKESKEKPESAKLFKRSGGLRLEPEPNYGPRPSNTGWSSVSMPEGPSSTFTFPAPNLMPVYSNTPKPYNYGNYNGPPSVINYKPGNSQSTLPPLVFPPLPLPTEEPSLPPPEPEDPDLSIPDPDPSIPDPEEPNPSPDPSPYPDPIPDHGPIGPVTPSPSGMIVPIIVPPAGGTDTSEGSESEEGEEDIFPPSPPEIDEDIGVRSVGRTLALKANPPQFVRTRVTNVGAGSVRDTLPALSRLRTGSGSATANQGAKRVKVRLRDKVRESVENSEEDDQLGQPDPNIITDFVFSDIKCYKTRTREYFGSTIHMKSGYHQPYVRDRPQDPLTSKECRMDSVPGTDDVFHMTVTDLRGCGVEQCGDYLCLTMVFPRVPTLALADDEVTTIKCLPQKSTMFDTRTISFAGDSLDGRRSSSTVEGGGQDFAAEVGVFRQNPGSSNGLYVKRVNSGGVVQLGEMLQLRSIVRGGDGWKHSKLSDVKVWRMRDALKGNLDNLDPNEASEVITLVDADGCRNKEYQVIAERSPLKDPRNDLIHHFTFKAFLFRGQRANEPLVLTAKVHACQDDADCTPTNCDSSRVKRSPVEVTNSSAIIHDWDSKFALRVVGSKDHSASLTEEDFPTDYSGRSMPSSGPMTCTEKMAATGLGGGLIVLLLCGIIVALHAYVVKGRGDKPRENTAFLEHGTQNQHANPNINLAPPTGQFPSRNKPLPPLPPLPQEPRTSSSEMTNVAKILQHLADNTAPTAPTAPKDNQHHSAVGTYECVDETKSSRKSQRKKKDAMYVIYMDKPHRPKSAPPTLKKQGRKSQRSKKVDVFDYPSESPSQTEDATESSEDSTSSSGSDQGIPKKCVGFAGRRTVRNVKSRSSHHNPKQKVVSGIRRRLSQLYMDGRSGLGMGSGGGGKGGSYPSRMKSPLAEPPPTGKEPTEPHSSDLDSAYYGSEFNDDVLQEMRQLATQHRNSKKFPGKPHPHLLNKEIKQQLRRGERPCNSPQLEPGETKAAHFVTRNDTSTQILIVPETHV